MYTYSHTYMYVYVEIDRSINGFEFGILGFLFHILVCHTCFRPRGPLQETNNRQSFLFFSLLQRRLF